MTKKGEEEKRAVLLGDYWFGSVKVCTDITKLSLTQDEQDVIILVVSQLKDLLLLFFKFEMMLIITISFLFVQYRYK